MRKVLLVLFVFFSALKSFASAAGFSSFAPSAALADAYSARAVEAGSFIMNPAGLVHIYGPEVYFGYSSDFSDMSVNSFSSGLKLGRFGFGFYGEDFKINGDDGDFERNTLSLGLAYPLSTRVSLGASVNSLIHHSNTGEETLTTFDTGLYAAGYRGDSFSVVLKNIGEELEFKDASSRPAELLVGGAHRMGEFILSWDIIHSKELNYGWRAGIEGPAGPFIWRAGLRYEQQSDFNAGIGFPYERFKFDYAYTPHRTLGGIHRMSVGAYF